MERNVKKIGLVNLLVMLVLGIASFVLARYTNSLSGQAGSLFLGLGFLVMVVSYFQMRLEETERLERMEFDELTRAKSSSSLFNTSDAEVFPARRAREQFERFFVPGFTVVLLLLQAGGAYLCWHWFKNPTLTAIKQPMLALSIFALLALTLFLLGKYAAGLARLQNDRLVRPGASYLLLGAYICFVVAAAIAAVEAGFARLDLNAARLLGVVLALMAAENLINLVLEIYRPRGKTAAPHLVYDSQLIGLLSHPEGILTTAAHALDYQFGFKVSETWVYRFLEKAFAWLLLLQFAVLELSTCFVFIAPGEQGLIERWGRSMTERGVLNPGLHFKLPFPADHVYRAHTDQVQEFVIGHPPEKKEHADSRKVILWTVAHEEDEFTLPVASRQSLPAGSTNAAASEQGAPVDLLSVGIPVQFRINDIRAWMYNYTDAGALLEKIATREVVRYLVSVDLMKIMSSERAQAAETLRANIQTEADKEPKLGVQIIFVGLQDIHPPVGKGRLELAKKFEEVIAAQQEVEAKLLAARRDAATNLVLSTALADKKIREAQAYKVRTIAAAAANTARFTNQLLAYNASPQVFAERAYLQALVRGAANARKYIWTTMNTNDLIQMNLEDKLRPDLLDVPLPQKK